MAETTYFGSRVRAGAVIGDNFAGTMAGVGDVNLSQTAVVVGVSNGNGDASVTLPPGAQIISILAAKTVTQSVGAGTATTLNVSAGSAQGGAQYMPATDLFTNTNAEAPSTVATNLAAANITTNTTLWFRVAANGTILTTLPQVRFTVTYAMRS